MPNSIATNRAARDAVLSRVRKALGKTAERRPAMAEAQAYVVAHAHGPRPVLAGDLVTHFMGRATDMASTVERLAERRDIPSAVARYVTAVQTPPGIEPLYPRGVCWPEFADLDWASAGVSIEVRPTVGSDRIGITGSYCAVAETGTIVITSSADTPTATSLLPETHIAVVDAERIVWGMEEVFALLRAEAGGAQDASGVGSKPAGGTTLPRAINMISGPSRTGDIEQTIVLGAHGPYRLHILVVD